MYSAETEYVKFVIFQNKSVRIFDTMQASVTFASTDCDQIQLKWEVNSIMCLQNYFILPRI